MAKKYYQVMVRHHFLDSTGIWDYMDGEYSGVIHSTKADANKELREANKMITDISDYAFIEEMEN